MSVDILPLELSFARPFTVEVARTLTIRNTSRTPLAFKVKTTAPKQYCVRPNAGRIEPGNSFDVTVLLQAMKQDPPLDAKCRDKFLVQCAPISPGQDFASIASVLETAGHSQLTERKIRVSWLAANGEHASEASAAPSAALSTPTKASAANGTGDTPDAPRSVSSPGAGHANATSSSAPPPYRSDNGADEDEDAGSAANGPSTASRAAHSVSESAQLTHEGLKAKLAQAGAQPASLKDGGLRQRNVKSGASSDEKKFAGQTTQALKQQPDGVSVQTVAVMCLLSFLLAYLFF